MNKYTLTLLMVGFLVLPTLVLAESGVAEKVKQFSQEQKERASARVQKLEENVAARTKKREAALKERQEKSAERKQALEERKAEEKKNFCTNIVDRMSERQSDFAERQSEFTTKKSERLEERKAEREESDAELAEKRAAAADRRAKMYQNLLNKATTEEQKAAVAQFQQTVEKAVVDRQAALDAAKLAFRNGIDTARTSRKADGTEALAAFKTAMQSALTKAKADCEEGVDQSTVRQSYLSALEAARKTLSEARQNNGIGDTVSQLAKVRTEAVKAALNTYRTTVEEAFALLKKAFPSAEPEV